MAGTLVSLLGRPERQPTRRELRTLYRRVAKAWHPDAGGSQKAMAIANDCYERGDWRGLTQMLRIARNRR